MSLQCAAKTPNYNLCIHGLEAVARVDHVLTRPTSLSRTCSLVVAQQPLTTLRLQALPAHINTFGVLAYYYYY